MRVPSLTERRDREEALYSSSSVNLNPPATFFYRMLSNPVPPAPALAVCANESLSLALRIEHASVSLATTSSTSAEALRQSHNLLTEFESEVAQWSAVTAPGGPLATSHDLIVSIGDLLGNIETLATRLAIARAKQRALQRVQDAYHDAASCRASLPLAEGDGRLASPPSTSPRGPQSIDVSAMLGSQR